MAIADETDPLTNPAYAQDLCYGPQDLRRINGGFVCGEGVVGATSLAVSQSAVPAASVDVAVGGAWVMNDQDIAPLGDEGPYFVFNDEVQTLTIAANASGSSRIDAILVRVCDAQYAPFSSAFTLVVNQGTPGGGFPAYPADGCTYYLLASVAVANGFTTITNANITDAREIFRMCSTTGPYVALQALSNTTIAASGTESAVGGWDQLHIDGDYYTVTGGDSQIVTVLETGLYDVAGMTAVVTPGLVVEVGISVGGLTSIVTALSFVRAGSPATTRVGGSFSRTNVPLTAGDTLQVFATQSDGSTRSTADSGNYKSWFNVTKVG